MRGGGQKDAPWRRSRRIEPVLPGERSQQSKRHRRRRRARGAGANGVSARDPGWADGAGRPAGGPGGSAPVDGGRWVLSTGPADSVLSRPPEKKEPCCRAGGGAGGLDAWLGGSAREEEGLTPALEGAALKACVARREKDMAWGGKGVRGRAVGGRGGGLNGKGRAGGRAGAGEKPTAGASWQPGQPASRAHLSLPAARQAPGTPARAHASSRLAGPGRVCILSATLCCLRERVPSACSPRRARARHPRGARVRTPLSQATTVAPVSSCVAHPYPLTQPPTIQTPWPTSSSPSA